MQSLTGTVGELGANNASDVALVQAILLKIVRPGGAGHAAGPYLTSYDGICGDNTKKAIRAFQYDKVFVTAASNQSAPNPNATAGAIKPEDATWTKLLASVPAPFSDMRVLPGAKTVYLPASAADLQLRLASACGMTFNQAFLLKVRICIDRMHKLYGIGIGVCPQGDRRTFQAQYALLAQGSGVTNAGPGESNHNFGMAVDLGFRGLTWLHRDGVIDTNETPWLHHLTAASQAQAMLFWHALRTVGTSGNVGAFRGPEGDRPHLQNWNDANVSMGRRLAALLQLSGSMQWSFAQYSYHSDLGLGGAHYSLGTAAQIWSSTPALTAGMLTQALSANAAAQGQPPPAPATPTDLAAMRTLLRQQFDLADANWQNWTPQ